MLVDFDGDAEQLDDAADAEDASLRWIALPDSFVDPARWKRVLAGAWRDAAQITIKEGRSALLTLERAARHAVCRHAHVRTVGDNLAEVCAFERGPAKDHSLNALNDLSLRS